MKEIDCTDESIVHSAQNLAPTAAGFQEMGMMALKILKRIETATEVLGDAVERHRASLEQASASANRLSRVLVAATFVLALAAVVGIIVSLCR